MQENLVGIYRNMVPELREQKNIGKYTHIYTHISHTHIHTYIQTYTHKYRHIHTHKQAHKLFGKFTKSYRNSFEYTKIWPRNCKTNKTSKSIIWAFENIIWNTVLISNFDNVDTSMDADSKVWPLCEIRGNLIRVYQNIFSKV